jgi:hypothetical protein
MEILTLLKKNFLPMNLLYERVEMFEERSNTVGRTCD